MWKTVLLLIFTLILVPIFIFLYDDPLTNVQIQARNTLLAVYIIAAVLCFIVSSVTDNYSQVDKLWSVLPIAYVWIVAYFGNFSPRLILIAVLVSLWGIRLTLNFARRGGYSIKFWEGHEDYRWAILRNRKEFNSPWKWTLFNLFFISGYQMGLILLITLPALKAIEGKPAIQLWDIVLTAVFLFVLYIEYLADHQQYVYMEAKKSKLKNDETLDDYFKVGFTHTGLWAYMRHPNYAAEQGIWIIVYLFSIIATGQWLNWSIAGCLLLILLFKGSSDFSESVSLGKYPLYKKYVKEVGRFLPLKPRFNPHSEPKSQEEPEIGLQG